MFRAHVKQTADGESSTHGTFPVTFRGQGVEEVKEKGKKQIRRITRARTGKEAVCVRRHAPLSRLLLP